MGATDIATAVISEMDRQINRERTRAILRAAFPDPRIQIGLDLVDAVIPALPTDLQRSIVGEVLDRVTDVPALEESSLVMGYYTVHARHARQGVHAFVGAVPFVRVRVPEVQTDIPTKIGMVYAGDHKLYTLPQVRAELGEHVDFEIGSAEWITPARYFGARFSAVAILVLRDDHGVIAGYSLEAGMATGEPMVRYLARHREDRIVRRSWYAPTPLSHDRQTYAAEIAWEGSDPSELRIEVRDSEGTPPHMEVRARFVPTEARPIWPSLLTAQAAMRVAAICERMDRPLPGGPLGALFAAAGRATLDWEERP